MNETRERNRALAGHGLLSCANRRVFCGVPSADHTGAAVLDRRALIAGAAGAAIAGAPVEAGAQSAAPPTDPGSSHFDTGAILALARELAKTPYRASPNDLPEFLNNLTYDQYVAVRARPSATIWADANVGFAIEPLHRGFVFSAPMQIYVVEGGATRKLEYRVADFEFGSIQPPANVPDIAFSGFRVLAKRDNGYAEVAIFQGASFFRARAPGQSLGVQARGLSVRTADPRGEETPVFKAVWIEKPTLGENALVIHALLDSESAVGVYRISIRPAEATIIDTELTLLPRVAIDVLGIATMSAKSISSPLDRRRPDDVRPTIAEVNGLRMLTGNGEWIWRPCTNRTTLQSSSFVDNNPRGFGFLVRDRDFETYLDDENHWELRPSLWIEPLTDFGAGEVQLVEIPADTETNNNCVAFWRPRGGLPAGKEAVWAYRQFWCWSPPVRTTLASTVYSRAGRVGTARRRRFLVSFGGDILGDEAATADLKPALSTSPGQVQFLRWFHDRGRQRCRVLFDVDVGSENSVELRLLLTAGAKPVSETWLYRWSA